MVTTQYKPPVPCACGCGRLVVFDNPNNHNGKYFERKCAARTYRRRDRRERAQTIPVPDCVRGKKFTILKIPDPDAAVEEGRVMEYLDVLQTLKDGNFEPGTVIRADGRPMVVSGVVGYAQHLKFLESHGKKVSQ